MPTYELTPGFLREYRRLTGKQRGAFKAAVKLLVAGLARREIDPRLRVKRVRKEARVWEMTWAPDGRATFEYGGEVRPGDPHLIWLRIGGHRILKRPK